MVTLLDNGTGFCVVSANTNFSIRYGEFSLAIANIDIEKLREPMWDFYCEFEILVHSSSLPPNNDSKKKVVSKLRNPLSNLLKSEYLDINQSNIITDLLMEELECNIKSEEFNWMDDATFMPPIIREVKFRNQLHSILIRKSETLSQDINKKFSSNLEFSIMFNADGKLKSAYSIKDTWSLLIIDLQKYLETNIRIIKCQNCGRLFYPTSKNEKYCSFTHYDTNGIKSNKTCSELVHTTPTDYTALIFKRVRGAQRGRIQNVETQINKPSLRFEYDIDKLRDLYGDWKEAFEVECAKCRAECGYFEGFDYNEMIKFTTDEFDVWVKEHEFTPAYLEKKGIRTRKSKLNKPT